MARAAVYPGAEVRSRWPGLGLRRGGGEALLEGLRSREEGCNFSSPGCGGGQVQQGQGARPRGLSQVYSNAQSC